MIPSHDAGLSGSSTLDRRLPLPIPMIPRLAKYNRNSGSTTNTSPRKKRRATLRPRKQRFGESTQDVSIVILSSSPRSPDEFLTDELQLMFPHLHLDDDHNEADINFIFSTPRHGSLRRLHNTSNTSSSCFLPVPSLDVAAVGINNEDVPVITIGPRIRPMFRRVTQHVKTETAAVESPSRFAVKELIPNTIPFPVIVPLGKHQRPHPPIKDIEKDKNRTIGSLTSHII